VRFLWAKNMEAKDIHKEMLPIWAAILCGFVTYLLNYPRSFQILAFILTSQFHTKLHIDIIWFKTKGEAQYTLRVTLMLLFCILREKTEVAHFLRKSIMTTNVTAQHEFVHLHTNK
jgi:hypothetical protein